jgi:hypothetical protein
MHKQMIPHRSGVLLAYVAAVLVAHGCSQSGVPTRDSTSWITGATTEELTAALESSDAAQSEEFSAIVRELGTRVESADLVAPALARVLAYPRRDSYAAGRALLAMGNSARTATGELASTLGHDRADVRMFSALVLGVIGPDARCAVAQLASLLWDEDQYVRSAAAAAMESILGEDLVQPQDEISASHPESVAADSPEGFVSGTARRWWLEIGHMESWLPCASLQAPLPPSTATGEASP